MGRSWYGELPPELEEVAAFLEKEQGHIFSEWPPAGEDDDLKLQFLRQAHEAHAMYPGGLAAYHASAVTLLGASQRGENPLDGCTVEVPTGEKLYRCTAEFDEMSTLAVPHLASTAFVLVAGGLGERLGYPGIKLGLPVHTLPGLSTTYLEHYCRAIQSWEGLSNASSPIPLVIMTSDDTHSQTVDLLKEKGNFGMREGQITLLKQGKVPAISDCSGRFAMKDKYTMLTKPHGHGDIHHLLHMHGLVKKWQAEGREWVVFFQDTQSLMTHLLPATLGLSVSKALWVNSMSVPRMPGEQIGAICNVKTRDRSITVNVEYNQLEPLLLHTTGKGDEPGPDGYSAFPGNTNTLVFHIPKYAEVLEQTEGKVPEFVNPKYADSSRTVFKSPTRLECMMQDIPKSYPDVPGKVSFSCFDRELYSPLKNSTPDGAKKQREGQLASCAAVSEADWFNAHVELLRACGADCGEPRPYHVFLDVEFRCSHYVTFHPSFAPTRPELRKKISGTVSIAPGSVLCVKGARVAIRGLKLKGALVIDAVDDAEVTITDLVVENAGWDVVPCEDAHTDPATAIRGYRFIEKETRTLRFDSPGTYTVNTHGVKTVSG